jgi:hypothetical protein
MTNQTNDVRMTTNTQTEGTTARLEALGFSFAAQQVKAKKIKAKKLMLAYEHYRFVRQENIDRFNKALYTKTYGKNVMYAYQRLELTPIGLYTNVPPSEVLDALETAKALEYAPGAKVFDAYEVAYIQDVKDPILFGRVNGCTDKFFIADWGEDVKITDLLKENEG